MLHGNKNPTQSDEILAHLKNGKTLTSLEALDIFKCARLASRIADLRAAGHDIITTFEKHRGRKWARYSLAKDA